MANAARTGRRQRGRRYIDAKGKMIALLGVKDLVIVDTPDALLIVDRNRAQEVGAIVKELEERKRENLL
jgi:mannose-1-phosphate guanylyltransferase